MIARSSGVDRRTSQPEQPEAKPEQSRETKDDWIRTALASFKKREFKPGLQSYTLTKNV